MQLVCPKCSSKVNELMECDNCGTIGCIRCMKKSYGKWVCHKCEEPEKYYYPETESKAEDEVSDAFSSMFG
jgi:methionyl-tRNA synthetase